MNVDVELNAKVLVRGKYAGVCKKIRWPFTFA